MSWIKCTEAMPPAGSTVKMKWVDGETEWNGDPVLELRDVRIGKYGSLLWWRESPSLPNESGLREILEEALKDHENDRKWLLEKYPQVKDKIDTAVRPWIEKARKALSQYSSLSLPEPEEGKQRRKWIKD